MSITALPLPKAHAPLQLKGRSLAVRTVAVLLATGLLALCSWISVPMLPVPMTMQTFGVTVVGALFGWRLGLVAVLAWLAEGASGLPVFSGGGGGLARFAGPTAGYLVSFPIAAALVGWCAERGWMTGRVGTAFAVMALANLGILLIGAGWLALSIGVQHALALGVVPFLIGGLAKAGLAAVAIEVLRRPIASLLSRS